MDQVNSPFRTQGHQKLRDREAKRQAVLRAAVRMFNERGFHATSLEDVAASLGITKPTIYHYLGSKDQVLLECVTIGLEQLLDACEQARSQEGKAIERLRRFLTRYAEINMGDFGRCVVRTGEEALSSDSAARLRALKRRIDSAVRKLIEEGIADGSIARQDPKLLAFVLFGALNWPARWHESSGSQGPEELALAMVDILAAGFSPR